jgi:two-component system, NarL family, sensor histidine kinase BarA
MFRRLRQLRVSLAVKCQILFGAAVALIIGAALFVPWQRMEQLTEQINERTARTLCDDAIADHLAGIKANVRHAAPAPATTMPIAAIAEATLAGGRTSTAVPHLVLLASPGAAASLNPFEKRALTHFADRPDSEVFARVMTPPDGTQPIYRYARPLRADAGCLACHDPSSGRLRDVTTVDSASAAPATRPATAAAVATSRPAVTPVIGLVSLDMRTQVDTNQLLLNRIFLLAAGLLAGTLAIVVFYLITTRLILQPVTVLQETAEKVSKGDLNIRSHISTGDEFETLSKTFNVMLVNLKESQDQLRAINKSLDLKLNQLAESNVALYESNRLKSEFLANVSHELRTPLNSILGFAELLRDLNATEGRQTRYIQNILSSGKNLLELINDLLDLAKIEAGRMEVRSEPLSLNDLFEGLTSIIKPLAEKRGVTVQPSVAVDVPILSTDAPKLQQVLYNFLSNAIKFSPPAGTIELRAERDGADAVRILVSDQGPGIEPDKQQIIFEKFRQLDGSVTREHSGTGLGLAISKELVALLGGSIGVTSTPGAGATFWVRIPLKTAAGEQDLRRTLVLT